MLLCCLPHFLVEVCIHVLMNPLAAVGAKLPLRWHVMEHWSNVVQPVTMTAYARILTPQPAVMVTAAVPTRGHAPVSAMAVTSEAHHGG